jgi:drug/metabolite transporter (DMT)-like permease
MKIVAPVVGVSLTISSRIILASVILLAGFSLTRNFPDFRRNWKSYFFLGALNMAIPFALVTSSVIHLNASISAILNATTPMFTLLTTAIWLKEKRSFMKVAGMIVGLAGVLVLVGWIPLDLTREVYIAITMALAGALCYAIAGVYAKLRFSKSDPAQTATGQMTSASFLLLPVLFTSSSKLVFSADIVISILALGGICTAAAYTLFFRLISSAGAVNASLVTLIVPVFSLIWGVLFLGEPVSAGLLTGLSLVLTSLIMITKKTK